MADLAEIWAYIAEDSTRHANAFAARLDQEFRMLARQPNIGRERPELLAGLRSIPVERYVVFYIPTSRAIEVVRVLHGARDLTPFFDPEID